MTRSAFWKLPVNLRLTVSAVLAQLLLVPSFCVADTASADGTEEGEVPTVEEEEEFTEPLEYIIDKITTG